MMNNFNEIYFNKINQHYNFYKLRTIEKFSDEVKKYGVLWASTVNIGDDIQTLAGINFLKKHGINDYVFVDREELSDYNGEPIKLVMNGWYMHNIKKFPPSDKIHPIFVSMHVWDENLIKENVEYFKKHQPIGCRDEYTVKLFKKYGIDAYFTGCLTLLFDDVNEKKGGKYIVDLNSKVGYISDIDFDKSKYKDFEEIEHDINANKEFDQFLVTFIFDKNYIDIFFTVVKSIILSEYRNCKSKIVFLINYFGSDEEIKLIKDRFETMFHRNKIFIKNILKEYPDINKEINQCYDFKTAESQIQTASVYCRFYLDKIWSNFSGNLLYLDLDLIVRKPISDLFASLDNKHALFACGNLNVGKCMTDPDKFSKDFNKIIKDNKQLMSEYQNLKCKLGKENYDQNELGFNAGVWAMNLDNFRKNKYSDLLKLCMKIQAKKKVFKHNDQGIMNMIFYKNFKKIDKKWNVYDYGFQKENLFSRKNIVEQLENNFDDAKIIHYNGPDKPWKRKEDHIYPKCVKLWEYFEKFDTKYYYSYFTSMKLEDRLKMAKEIIDKYRNAELVVTTRLHVMLPCRAFNTNAIFVHKNYYDDPRFEGLREVLNGDTKITDKKNIDRNKKIKEIRDNFLSKKI